MLKEILSEMVNNSVIPSSETVHNYLQCISLNEWQLEIKRLHEHGIEVDSETFELIISNLCDDQSNDLNRHSFDALLSRIDVMNRLFDYMGDLYDESPSLELSVFHCCCDLIEMVQFASVPDGLTFFLF